MASLYEVLGIPETASQEEVRRAYKVAAMKHHPDKGGDPEHFKSVGCAYDVLADPEKRKCYDREKKKKKNGAASAAEEFDLAFFIIFGFRTFGDESEPKADVKAYLDVTLEDLYFGAAKKVSYLRKLSCSKCPGKRKRCNKCKGERQQTSKAEAEVYIKPGTADGKVIRVYGLGDSKAGAGFGDLLVKLRLLEHDRFTLLGKDLVVEYTISLREALCGFVSRLKLMDARWVLLKSAPKEIIKPGSCKCIPGEGMPDEKHPWIKGRLFVKFQVHFPVKASDELQAAVKSVLAAPAAPVHRGCNYEEKLLLNVDDKQLRTLEAVNN